MEIGFSPRGNWAMSPTALSCFVSAAAWDECEGLAP
jgi:hypothetical protein